MRDSHLLAAPAANSHRPHGAPVLSGQETDRDRQTDRQDRQTDKQIDKERQKER